jgi:hypothetical protein
MISRIGVQPVIVSVGGAAGRQTYRVAEVVEGVEEEPSNEVACSNDLSIDGNLNVVHWQGEASLFRVYRATGGIFSMIAETADSRFLDTGEV